MDLFQEYLGVLLLSKLHLKFKIILKRKIEIVSYIQNQIQSGVLQFLGK